MRNGVLNQDIGLPLCLIGLYLLAVFEVCGIYSDMRFGIGDNSISHPVTGISVFLVCGLRLNRPNKRLLCSRYDFHHNEDSA